MSIAEKEQKRDRIEKIRSRKRVVRIVFVILLVAVVAFVIFDPFGGSMVGEKAPEFGLRDIDGNAFSLSDHRGEVVVLDLMATWCGPCITQMGELKDIYNKYGRSQLVIMSIDVDTEETNAQLTQFKRDYGDDWIFARDTDGVGNKYNVDSIPKIVIIDKEGRIAYEDEGVTSSSTLSSEIDKLL